MDAAVKFAPVAGKLVGPAYNLTKDTIDIVHADEDYRGCRISAREAHSREVGAVTEFEGKTGGGIVGGVAGGALATSWIPIPGARIVGGLIGGFIGAFTGGKVAKPIGKAVGGLIGGDDDCYYDHIHMKGHE